MTNEQLSELLERVTPGDWEVEVDEYSQVAGYPIISSESYTIVGSEGMYGDLSVDFANAELIALAPSLARRVLAAEKLVEALHFDILTMDAEDVRKPHLKRRVGFSRKALAEYAAAK